MVLRVTKTRARYWWANVTSSAISATLFSALCRAPKLGPPMYTASAPFDRLHRCADRGMRQQLLGRVAFHVPEYDDLDAVEPARVRALAERRRRGERRGEGCRRERGGRAEEAEPAHGRIIAERLRPPPRARPRRDRAAASRPGARARPRFSRAT